MEQFNFSFFSITGWGIDLDYHDIERFALETEIILLFLRLHPISPEYSLEGLMLKLSTNTDAKNGFIGKDPDTKKD